MNITVERVNDWRLELSNVQLSDVNSSDLLFTVERRAFDIAAALFGVFVVPFLLFLDFLATSNFAVVTFGINLVLEVAAVVFNIDIFLYVCLDAVSAVLAPIVALAILLWTLISVCLLVCFTTLLKSYWNSTLLPSLRGSKFLFTKSVKANIHLWHILEFFELSSHVREYKKTWC